MYKSIITRSDRTKKLFSWLNMSRNVSPARQDAELELKLKH